MFSSLPHYLVSFLDADELDHFRFEGNLRRFIQVFDGPNFRVVVFRQVSDQALLVFRSRGGSKD